jgi:hypothetical protein
MRTVRPVNVDQPSVTDPDGRVIVFDAGSHLHLAEGRRSWLLDHLQEILATIARPDHRERDPRPGRERFYRENVLRPGRWMRVVVDCNQAPGWVVTVLIQHDDPRKQAS